MKYLFHTPAGTDLDLGSNTWLREPLVGDLIQGKRSGLYRVTERTHVLRDSDYVTEGHVLHFQLEVIRAATPVPPPQPSPVAKLWERVWQLG